MNPYNPQQFEEKWQSMWEKQELFQGLVTADTDFKEKFYALFAFAYPSGSGLHVGHVESKTALDIYVRFLRMQGKDVLFPVGWDAFGLPAENYAIKTGVHPAVTTKNAIDTFRSQIKRLAISYDWKTELATSHPGYYKWTQWIFIKLFQAGLAYRDISMVNWCPSCMTVLANEQVVEGACERCGASVIQKELEQWKFRITAYQDELLSGLEKVDWPQATKQQQMNWIGKSEGVSIDFTVKQSDMVLTVWTKFWETVFGVTFVVIAPEKFKDLGLLSSVPSEKKIAVDAYIDQAAHKTEEQRRIGEKEKTGVHTGIYLVNPVNGQDVPLFIADYVLMNVGTGIVMGVPSHDERDFQFAKKFSLPCIQVVSYADKAIDAKVIAGEMSYEGEGTLVNSGDFSGQSAWGEGKAKMAEWMIAQGFAKRQTTYKLRDWLISRQRYWGAPIPMVFCENCAKNGKGENASMPGWFTVSFESLPVSLPKLDDFKPTADGKSPLEKADEDWKYSVCPGCGGKAKREVDTMDTFVDSSWYYLRYTAARDEGKIFDPALVNTLLPVDLYLIGPEHIVLHLLYSRFFTKFLRDQGYLNFDEPFFKMRHQGMILGPDGKKMSKSKGNVINPDEIIEKFGADTLRVYEMFMGPLDADKAWDMSSVAGVYRFLSRIYKLVLENSIVSGEESLVAKKKLNQTIEKITSDIPQLKFNTSIAALMEFTNTFAMELEAGKKLEMVDSLSVVKLLAPFAPFLAEELWHALEFSNDKTMSVHTTAWPQVDHSLLVEACLPIVVQVNGKIKVKIEVDQDVAQDRTRLETFIMAHPSVIPLIEGHSLKKVIVVVGKLVNIVL